MPTFSYGNVRVEVYGGVITAWSLPGGMVWRWARQRRVRVERLARAYAPKRTGELSRSINGWYDPAPPQHVVMNVGTSIGYGAYVHEGTYGPIVPKFAKYMHLQPAWGGHPEMFRKVVNGQPSQPFLVEALWEVMSDL